MRPNLLSWSLLLAVLGLGMVQLSACERKSFDPALAGSFFPLRPGLSWSYRIIDKDHNSSHILTDRVLEPRRLGSGQGANEVESEYSAATGAFKSSIIYFPEHGYFTRQSLTDRSAGIASAERAFLPQLLKPGLIWSNSLEPFTQEANVLHVSQTHQSFFDAGTVVVPAGHFSNCIRIETHAVYWSSYEAIKPLELKYIDWYAPHVGLVKTIVQQNGIFGSELARIELLSFKYTPSRASLPGSVSVSRVRLQHSSDPRTAR